MPTVQFTYMARGLSINRQMPAPKRVTEIYKGWYKSARAVIPEIPLIPELIGSYMSEFQLVADPDIGPKWIRFDMMSSITGETCQLVIDRKGPSF